MPVRSKSASLRASTLSLLLPSFNKALRRGLQTTTSCTCDCSRSYSQDAQVPSSQVTCNSPRRPWINCRRLLALVSTMDDSITSFPLPFRTAITIASLCTSMPIYLMSRLIQLPPWGKDHSRLRSLSLKVQCLSPADLPIPSWSPFALQHHRSPSPARRQRSVALRQRSEAEPASPSFELLKQGALS